MGEDFETKAMSNKHLTVELYQDKSNPSASMRDRLEEVLSGGGIWRMRDLAKAGITAAAVQRAVAEGVVEAVSRGLYRWRAANQAPNQQLAELAARVPNVIICLLSAAHFHGLVEATPHEIWGAIPNSQTTPKLDRPPFRPVRWRTAVAREVGIEVHEIAGVSVQITGPARTAVDMLRMATTVGENSARNCLRSFMECGCQIAELHTIAKALNVTKATSQYLRGFIDSQEGKHGKRRGSDPPSST